MTPDRSWRTRWRCICSCFSSSFWKSSIWRLASRRLRSNWSCLSRRASAAISGPFFSSSSRSFSSSTRLPSISRCIAAFSRSSWSRAATPAADRASTRCTSMNATRVPPQFPDAGACALTGAALAPTSAAAATSATLSATFDFLIQPPLERRPNREVKRPEALARLPIKVDSVIDSDRTERRLPSYTSAGRLAKIRRVELGAEPVDVADVEERRDPKGEGQRDDVLDVAEQLARPARLEAARVPGRETVELEAPDRVRAAEIKPLEDRQRVFGPAETVPRLGSRPDDVVEPDRLEIGLEAGQLDELRVAAETGEVGVERRLAPLGRGRDEIAAVARQRGADRRRDADAFLGFEVRRRNVGDLGDVVARHPVTDLPAPELLERVAHAEV